MTVDKKDSDFEFNCVAALVELRSRGYSRSQLKELVDIVCNDVGRGEK